MLSGCALYMFSFGFLLAMIATDALRTGDSDILWNPATGENYNLGFANADDVYFLNEDDYAITKNVEGTVAYTFVVN